MCTLSEKRKSDRITSLCRQTVKASVIVVKTARYQIGLHISSCAISKSIKLTEKAHF